MKSILWNLKPTQIVHLHHPCHDRRSLLANLLREWVKYALCQLPIDREVSYRGPIPEEESIPRTDAFVEYLADLTQRVLHGIPVLAPHQPLAPHLALCKRPGDLLRLLTRLGHLHALQDLPLGPELGIGLCLKPPCKHHLGHPFVSEVFQQERQESAACVGWVHTPRYSVWIRILSLQLLKQGCRVIHVASIWLDQHRDHGRPELGELLFEHIPLAHTQLV